MLNVNGFLRSYGHIDRVHSCFEFMIRKQFNKVLIKPSNEGKCLLFLHKHIRSELPKTTLTKDLSENSILTDQESTFGHLI